MKVKYNLIKKEKDTWARLGTFETNYGTFDTPMFMPVGTRATVKMLTPEELKDAHSGVILANTKEQKEYVFDIQNVEKFINLSIELISADLNKILYS